MTITHEVAATTHIGATHAKNQDAVAVLTREVDGEAISLLAVADGVSSGKTSEKASRLVADRLVRALELLQPPVASEQARDMLVRTAADASQSIAGSQRGTLVSSDATTLAAALCVGTRAHGIWIGDSRVYLVSRGDVKPLTVDHSWAQEVTSRGLLSEEEARSDPRARMITRWLGPQEQLQPTIETFDLNLADGDVLLCCSDGLYMYFSPPFGSIEEMGEIVRGAPDLEAGLRMLEEKALQRGGHDDISAAALLLHVDV